MFDLDEDECIRDRHGGSELRKLHETLSTTSYPILCVYIYHEATIRILFACTGKWFAIKLRVIDPPRDRGFLRRWYAN